MKIVTTQEYIKTNNGRNCPDRDEVINCILNESSSYIHPSANFVWNFAFAKTSSKNIKSVGVKYKSPNQSIGSYLIIMPINTSIFPFMHFAKKLSTNLQDNIVWHENMRFFHNIKDEHVQKLVNILKELKILEKI